MFKKALILLQVIIVTTLLSTTNAVSVWTLRPRTWNPDIPQQPTQIDWSRSFLDILSVVNSYLRFAIWFVCFLFMIRNGFKLIMSRWDEKDMKSAQNALIWCGVWLVTCFLAYIIVNIAIKLFS